MTQNIPAHGSNIARKDINEIYKWKIDDLYADKEVGRLRPKFKSRTPPF